MKTINMFRIAVATALATWSLDLLAADDQELSTGGLQEIVVTAQKRTEDVDKVPISIAVYTQVDMDRQGVRDINDIYQLTPGVNFEQQGEYNHLSIRGIASNAGAATAGVYIDDVPIQVRVPTINIVGTTTPKVFDLDRVEILRGPQGTYFGAGAEAGAIRFITPTPSLTQSTGYTREGFNAVDSGGLGYEAGVAVGGPIVPDELGYRASASYQRVAGYIDHYSTIPGGINQADSNWSETAEAKGALLFQPTANLKITPQIFFQNIDTHDLSNYDPPLSDPGTGSYVNGSLLGEPGHQQVVLPQLKVEYDMGPVSFTSISAYLYRESVYGFDYTNLIPLIVPGIPNVTNPKDFTDAPYLDLQKNLSQEFRLQNTDPNAKLKWVVGAWYSLAKQLSWEGTISPGFNNLLTQYTGHNILQTYGCCTPGQLASQGNVTGTPSGYLLNNDLAEANNYVHDRQIAGYGQVDWEFVSRLTLTLGVRYAHQSNDFSFNDAGPLDRGAILGYGRESENVTTPKYGLSYQINDKNMVYVSASKGNRMGGGNTPFLVLPGCAQQLAQLGVPRTPDAYTSDFVWNYEIGTKNRLFNDRLTIEASAFHMDWTDLQQQISVPKCTSSFVANIGKATSDGFDLQINAQATDHIRLGTAVGYVKAVIGETKGIPGGTIFVNKGDQISAIQAPWTVTAQAEYDFKLFDTQPAYVRVDDEFHSKNPGPFTFQNPDSSAYDPTTPINPSQNLINLRIGTIAHGWDVAIYGTNLANSHPLLDGAPLTEFIPWGHAYTLTPRTIGVTGNYHW